MQAPPIDGLTTRTASSNAAGARTRISRSKEAQLHPGLSVRKAIVGLGALATAVGIEYVRRPVIVRPHPHALPQPLAHWSADLSAHQGTQFGDPIALHQAIFVPHDSGGQAINHTAMEEAIRTHRPASVFDAQHLASFCMSTLSETVTELDGCLARNPALCAELAKSLGLEDCTTLKQARSETVQHVYNVGRLAIARTVGVLLDDAPETEPILLTASPGVQLVKALPDAGIAKGEPAHAVTISAGTTNGRRMRAAIVLLETFMKPGGTPVGEKMVHEQMHALQSRSTAVNFGRMLAAGEMSEHEAFLYGEMMAQAMTSHWIAHSFQSSLETAGGTKKLFFDTLSYATASEHRPLTQATYEDGLLVATTAHFVEDTATQMHVMLSFLKAIRSPLPHKVASIYEKTDVHIASVLSMGLGLGLMLGCIFDAVGGHLSSRGVDGQVREATLVRLRAQLAEARRTASNADTVLLIAAHAGERFSPKLAADVQGARKLTAYNRAIRELQAQNLLDADGKINPEHAPLVREHLVADKDSRRDIGGDVARALTP